METNAIFTSDSLVPAFAGDVPMSIYPLISRIVAEQELTLCAVAERDLDKAFCAFVNDPLVTVDTESARALFNEMVEKTSKYLDMYKK